MPAKNSIKEYAPDSYYHLYNRGVAKLPVFLDDQDYKVFLSYLKTYLSSPENDIQAFPSRKLKNYFEKIKLLAYCLMPNHFHLLMWQKEINGLSTFIHSLLTKYSMYFNKKYKRVGPVFQGKLKGVIVQSEPQFIYLSKYIHRNPLDITSGPGPEVHPYSSYRNYLGVINQQWVDATEILSYFSKINRANSYRAFVEELDERDLPTIKELMLDFEF
ncbi:MAG: transposase [Candidatus Beckwithbacteria bacterium]|nr:transposase [Candidatus Beckwithbacteria bacterium]